MVRRVICALQMGLIIPNAALDSLILLLIFPPGVEKVYLGNWTRFCHEISPLVQEASLLLIHHHALLCLPGKWIRPSSSGCWVTVKAANVSVLALRIMVFCWLTWRPVPAVPCSTSFKVCPAFVGGCETKVQYHLRGLLHPVLWMGLQFACYLLLISHHAFRDGSWTFPASGFLAKPC